jgi:hypothetical protein
VALLHDGIDPLVIGDHCNRDAIVHLGRAVVHNEQVWVWLRGVGVAGDGNKSESSSSVESELFAGDIACLEVVYLEHLQSRVNQYLGYSSIA